MDLILQERPFELRRCGHGLERPGLPGPRHPYRLRRLGLLIEGGQGGLRQRLQGLQRRVVRGPNRGGFQRHQRGHHLVPQ